MSGQSDRFDPAASANLIVHGPAESVLPRLPDEAFTLIAIDPPFNTGRTQRAQPIQAIADPEGTRVGFGGRTYRTSSRPGAAYRDTFDDYLAFLVPHLHHARRLLSARGTLYVHLDAREAHYVKVALDEIFGREAFLNEIIWAYDFGGRSKRRWPAKHDTILVYVKDPGAYHFDSQEVDREPYMAPGLVSAEKAARGKLPTDVWWHTIVATNGGERTGYPTQKPEGIVRRMVAASTATGDWCLDFFAGSGTLGACAAGLGRRYVLVDQSADAIDVMRTRLGGSGTVVDVSSV
ncbi:MAG TPA: site-specific DNA-methyltransferase [Miltoncostaeales bacterium]|nr:site-specific DNA-methyltransferase [Miltoncostaeales bacterium]